MLEYSSPKVLLMLALLVTWGFVQPFFSYFMLRKFTKIDPMTAVVISACFGSISVMTYVAGSTFLHRLDVQYEGVVIAALAIMEVPAIISGLFLSKSFGRSGQRFTKKLFLDAVFNRTILIIFAGMFVGGVCYTFQWDTFPRIIGMGFKPFLSIFLLNMGWLVGSQRRHLRDFSRSLVLFGLYMPLIGAAFGMFLSYVLGLDAGTGTLITLLCASASYIAVPAVMKIALPEAREAVYLSLSLGITFPFNVVIGIPLYYHVAIRLLS